MSEVAFVVAHDHPSLPGHFPGRPVVPGVVILDRVLAAIEAEIAAEMGAAHGPFGPLRLPQVKFLQPLSPGEAVQIDLAQIESAAGASPRWKFRVLRGETAIATGEVAAG